MSRRDVRNQQRQEPSEGQYETDLWEARPKDVPPPEVAIRFQLDQDREALRLISWPSIKRKQVGEHKAFRKTGDRRIVSKDLTYHKSPEAPRGWLWPPSANIVYFGGTRRVGHKNGDIHSQGGMRVTVTTAQKVRIYGADEDKPNSHWPDPEPNMVYNWSGGPRRVTFKDGSFVILQAGEAVFVDNPEDYPFG